MASGVQPSKRALRAEIRERRRIMTTTERDRAATGLLANLQALTVEHKATQVACYLSTPDEPPTREFISWALGQGITIYLPVSREDGLMDWAPYDGGIEAMDSTGMPIPTSDLLGPRALQDAELILIPAASIAANGMRLGWGRGYFDRTLGSLTTQAPVFAVVFESEVVEDVPTEQHDQPVDGVVTPRRIIRYGQ
jgi:5-formyltetrahydrofolate cyclo-ligase